jgi:mono/diheme cytochrome c family protein
VIPVLQSAVLIGLLVPADAPARAEDTVVTFSKQIAPILLRNCAPCHRPGQSAPFPLLTYADAKKHASDIAKVTAMRYMPPWLPAEGFGEFAGERHLTEVEIKLIQQWVASGATEGNRTDLPPLPRFPEGWQLGEPDLIVQMPETCSRRMGVTFTAIL